MSSLSKLRSKIQCFGKSLSYEINYNCRKFRPHQALSILVSVIGAVVINFGGAQSFFLDRNSLIPGKWPLFRDPNFVSIISILVIVVPYLISYVFETSERLKEATELSEVARDSIVPAVENELNKLRRGITQRYKLDNKVRLSVFVPVRVGLLQWRLQMVCKTKNVENRELEAVFYLNEGVLGFTFLRANKFHVEFLDVSNPTNIPSTYIPLSQDNQNLIDPNIKGVVAVAAFQESAIAGLLAIDTSQSIDLQKMKDQGLHRDALSWIIDRRKTIRMLWRMKNNV